MSRARKEFTAKTKMDAFSRAGGRCEAILSTGERCPVTLRSGHWQCDHIIADAHGGKPVLSNAQCLCSACHLDKTKRDTTTAAKLKRVEAKHIGAKAAPAKPIRSAGFPVSGKRAVNPMPSLPYRSLYAEVKT